MSKTTLFLFTMLSCMLSLTAIHPLFAADEDFRSFVKQEKEQFSSFIDEQEKDYAAYQVAPGFAHAILLRICECRVLPLWDDFF